MNKIKQFFQRNLSIKWSITMWYMFLMTGLVAIFLSIILYLSNNIIRQNVYDYLKNGVQNSFSQIESDEEGNIIIDNKLDTILGVVEISIYNKDKEFVYGNSSIDFEYDDNFDLIKKFNTLKYNHDKWYIYEDVKNYPNYGNIWVRGIIKATLLDNIIQFIILRLTIGLPIFLLFSGITGFLIIRNSLKPINFIKNTALKIHAGNDLTKRINLGEGKNEVYTLANTFDGMFDKLQNSFDSEVQFTSDVSHELRTPISVIKSQAEYGKTNIVSINEAKDIFNIIYDESQKMSNLVSQLLTLARMDKGYHKLNLENINLTELIEIVAESQKFNAEQKSITITYDLEENIFADVDEHMIMRVFINLISNAISYGKENGFIHITLQLSEDKKFILIEIKDNGIGISKENINKIWDRFFQVESSRTGDNSGLGLPMVRGIVEAHNGEITVESKLDIGSTFKIKLPKKI